MIMEFNRSMGGLKTPHAPDTHIPVSRVSLPRCCI